MQAEIQAILKRFARRLLLTRICESAILFSAGSAALCGLVMMVILVTRLSWPGELWILPALCIPAGALTGVFVALIKGTSNGQAAVLIDARYQLKEKLTTAAEFLEENIYSPAVLCIFDQAATAAKQIPARPSFRKNPPAITAAFVLGVMFCGLLSLIPDNKPKQSFDETTNIENNIKVMSEMSPDLRTELALAISAVPTDDPKIQAELKALARAVIDKDQVEQRRILTELRRVGYRPIAILPEYLQQEFQTGPNQVTNISSPDENTYRLPVEDSKRTAASQPVRIFHPDYTNTASPSAEETQATSPITTTADPAWTAAKAQTAKNTQLGKIPPSYEAIIGRFYKTRIK